MVLFGTGTLLLAAVSLPFVLVGFTGAGETVREEGVGVRDCEAVVAAVLGVLTRLIASRRSREAGEPGRRWARRERWLAPEGGRASLEAGRGNCVGAGAVVGELQGLEGLGHLEDGSGQTGLLGWEAAP